MTVRLGVLASGRGSNFQAIARAIREGTLDAEIALLISDRQHAAALDVAGEFGIPAHYLPYDKNDREAFEREAARLLDEAGVHLVILAGFMRIITPFLIDHFQDRMLNIHPSLLPAFKGLDAQRQALAAGVKVAGCSVHLVTAEMDSGPILGQRAVKVLETDTVSSLSLRILEQEHQLYAECIRDYAAKKFGSS